jgi:hypothetical protein
MTAILVTTTANCVRADYVTQTVPLYSETFGIQAGIVRAEANSTVTMAVNGLLPGQVRLTYSVLPLAVYGTIYPTFGISEALFNVRGLDPIDLTTSVSIPPNWQLDPLHYPLIVAAAEHGDARAQGVTITISGLGDDATLDHFLFSSPSGTSFPSVFSVSVGGFATSTDHGAVAFDYLDGNLPAAAPEPSSIILGSLATASVLLLRKTRKRP